MMMTRWVFLSLFCLAGFSFAGPVEAASICKEYFSNRACNPNMGIGVDTSAEMCRRRCQDMGAACCSFEPKGGFGMCTGGNNFRSGTYAGHHGWICTHSGDNPQGLSGNNTSG